MAKQQNNTFQPVEFGQTDYGTTGTYRSVGAYSNPAVFANDYTVIQSNLSRAGAGIVQSAMKIAGERKRIADELRSSYDEYTQKRLIEANNIMGQKTQEAMNKSIESFENFLGMSEQEKQRALLSVDQFNNATKAISKGMNEIGSYDIDLRDMSKPSVLLISEMQKGNTDAFEMVPYTDGRIGADFVLKLKDENGNFTGESVTITQDQVLTQLGSVRDVTPTIEAYNKQLDTVGSEMRKIVSSAASRGKDFSESIITDEIDNMYATVFTDDTKSTIWSNVISKGEDWHPKNDPQTNEPFKNKEEKEAYWQGQDEMFKNYLKSEIDRRVYKEALYIRKTKEDTTTNSSGGNKNKQKVVSEVIPLGQASNINADNEDALNSAIEKIATRLLAGSGARDAATGGIPSALRNRIKDALLKAQSEGNSALAFKGDVITKDGKKYNIQDAFFTVNPRTGQLQLHWDNYAGLTEKESKNKELTADELIAKYSE